MNVNIDRAPILGEVPGLPGFFNNVSSNGYTLGPVLSRLTAEMVTASRPACRLKPIRSAGLVDDHNRVNAGGRRMVCRCSLFTLHTPR